jgi:tRNA U34 5-carboxymethylaminomethyl modifying enzyme MnmG/GidA
MPLDILSCGDRVDSGLESRKSLIRPGYAIEYDAPSTRGVGSSFGGEEIAGFVSRRTGLPEKI